MNNAKVKINPEITERKEQEAVRLRQRIERSKIIITIKGHAGWEAMRAEVGLKLDAAERVLDTYEEYDDRGRDRALAQRQMAKFFISMVEDYESNLDHLSLRLQKLEAEIVKRRDEHAGAHQSS